MYKSVIFDVDGTLLDASAGIIKSVKFMMDKFGLSLPHGFVMEDFVGPPIQNSCKRIFKADDKQAQKFADIFRSQYASGDVFCSTPYPNIYDLLELLKKKKIALGVATYKREDYAIDLMKHFEFDKYFDSICGADNENKLKKIDILKNCISNLAGKLDETVLIGDSIHDGGAAKELGVDFIGVTYGFGFKSKDDMKEYNPVLCAESVQDIIEFFKKNQQT